VALLAPYWPFPFAAERTPPVGAAVVVARVGHTQRVSLSVATVAELVRVLEQGDRMHGDRMKFLFFWGHRPEPGGRIGAGCLSQWWPSPFTVDGVEFATAEHYMMWRKATLFGDADTAEQILAAAHPSQAKALGRRVRGFDEQLWQDVRFESTRPDLGHRPEH
jgi:NADAR domain